MIELDPFGTKQKNFRKNRKKRRRSESTSSEEEWFSSDESIKEDEVIEDQEEQNFASGPWTYDLDMVLVKEEFQIKDMCREMNASDFTIEYVLEKGLEEPLLFKDSLSALGMKMPKDGTLTARCVLKAVGDRLVEVVDVMTQGSRKMMLSDFVDYYESPPAERKDLLNLLSLEFSLTSLSKKVRGPALAMEIDWVELYWPKHLRNSPSTFPKVQSYCLMSVKSSFTDFHIDFGGTSVWYHVYKGRKIFWIVEPTEENIVKYERWILEGTQHEAFFGDLVDRCARIELYEGCTFIIPSGWIHAVYTPEDSLVFGGNFLHSFSIPMQLRIIRSEEVLMIKEKYRYPSYMEMVWYVIKNIVKKATSHIDEIKKTSENISGSIDQEIDSDASSEEVGKKDDDVMIHVDNLVADATTDVKKEAGIDVMSTSEVKEVTMDSAAIEDKLEENEADGNSLTYNDEYLATISKKEREGFKCLLVYLREVVSNHKDSADQAKAHLLDVFEQVLGREVPERFVVEKGRGRGVEQQHSPKLNQWLKTFEKNKPLAVKRKISPKEKVVEMQQFSRPKPSKSKVKINKKPDCHKRDGPLIVGGIPPAIMPAGVPQAPNPYGYDPLASVTPLGHKQLPSAYRRTPDMAKVPPTQKFRLQPHLQKVVVAAADNIEAIPGKAVDNSWPANITFAAGPSNDNNSGEYESKTAAIAQADVKRGLHYNESVRSYHSRSKDNQRDNRHTIKEEYPELQYRSPLVRPGPSNKGTSVASELGRNSYRYQSKAFKRRYTDSSLTADCWSNGRSGMRRGSDCYSKRNEYSTSWRSELHYLSRWSPAAKVAVVIKDHEKDKNLSIVQRTGVIEQYSSRSEHGVAAVQSSSPSALSESHASTAIKSVKSAELEKPEIRDLSLTLNNDKEDSAGIVTATEELAELTKVFDVDERDSEKESTEPLMVTKEQGKPKRHSLNSLNKTDGVDQSGSSPLENLKADSDLSLSKLSKIPTETVLQNLSSLTEEFNAVVG